MIPNLSNVEKIIKYLDEEYEPGEISDFEEQLFFDNSLAEDFLLIKEIEENLKEINIEEFSHSMRRVHYAFKEYEYVNETLINLKLLQPQRNKRHLFLYKTAAIIIAVIGITFFLYHFNDKRTDNSGKIFAKYYTTYELNGQYRSTGERLKYFQRAFDAYERKNYHLATDYFNQITELDNAVLFYKGIAHIECNELIPAINCFETILNHSNNIFASQTHWYLALVFLKLDQPSNAKTHLNWLIQNNKYNNYFGSQAVAILKDMN